MQKFEYIDYSYINEVQLLILRHTKFTKKVYSDPAFDYFYPDPT